MKTFREMREETFTEDKDDDVKKIIAVHNGVKYMFSTKPDIKTETFTEDKDDDVKKIIAVWEKDSMEPVIGRGWKYKGSMLRTADNAAKSAAKAIGANDLSKTKVHNGVKYMFSGITLSASKSSKDVLNIVGYTPQ